MKKILHISTLLTLILILFSCSAKIGDWDDNIKLSTKSVEFGAAPDSVTITTGGSWWWVNNVSVNGKSYCGFAGVSAEADTYKIQQDCFLVERRNKNTLFIKIGENKESIKKTIIVNLEAGDYFGSVMITQKPR